MYNHRIWFHEKPYAVSDKNRAICSQGRGCFFFAHSSSMRRVFVEICCSTCVCVCETRKILNWRRSTINYDTLSFGFSMPSVYLPLLSIATLTLTVSAPQTAVSDWCRNQSAVDYGGVRVCSCPFQFLIIFSNFFLHDLSQTYVIPRTQCCVQSRRKYVAHIFCLIHFKLVVIIYSFYYYTDTLL